jgi:hypothetical protein
MDIKKRLAGGGETGDRIGRDFRQQKDLLVTCIEGEGV